MFLSDLSIKRPVFATMMALALVVLGIFSYRRLSIDLFPDVEFPFLVIQTRYAGASPESVEREVTKHLEEAVNPVEGGKLGRRDVIIGIIDEVAGLVQVREGIAAGAQVVVGPAEGLAPGQAVEVAGGEG